MARYLLELRSCYLKKLIIKLPLSCTLGTISKGEKPKPWSSEKTALVSHAIPEAKLGNTYPFIAPLSRYGMIESRKRLEKAGFHPRVTARPLKELEQESISQLRKKIHRPSRRTFRERQRRKLDIADVSTTGRRVRSGRLRSNAARNAMSSSGPLTRVSREKQKQRLS